MRDENAITKEIDDLTTFQVLTRSYTEIAAIQMRKTRDGVLKNREFLARLDDVFTDVRISYARQILSLGTRKGIEREKITFLSHNGRPVSVFLSANTGLYGDILGRTFDLFLKEVEATGSEVTIVGRIGLQYFLAAKPNTPYVYFDMSDRNIVSTQISELIKHLVQYEEISVYYPTFQSAVIQKPTKYTISAETPLSEIRNQGEEKTSYIFEPTLKKILAFFENETFASLMDQTVRESQLAKFAARIMALDRAGQNIKNELKELGLSKLRVSHRNRNKKQQETMVSQFK